MSSWFDELLEFFICPAQPPVTEEDIPSVDFDKEGIIARLEHAAIVNNHTAESTERIDCLCTNIVEYLNLLNTINSLLRFDQPWTIQLLTVKSIKVCNFYKKMNGDFHDVELMRKKMIDAMIELVNTYDAALKTPSPSASLMYVIWRSRTVMHNIETLSTQLAMPRLEEE